MSNIKNIDRRRFSRIPFEASVSITSPHGSWTGKLIDISLKGLLATIPHQWTGKSGDDVFIEIHPPEAFFSIRMEATIAHTDTERVGLRCNHIDLDSASHLHRLIELNLGDQVILTRELSVMGIN